MGGPVPGARETGPSLSATLSGLRQLRTLLSKRSNESSHTQVVDEEDKPCLFAATCLPCRGLETCTMQVEMHTGYSGVSEDNISHVS